MSDCVPTYLLTVVRYAYFLLHLFNMAVLTKVERFREAIKLSMPLLAGHYHSSDHNCTLSRQLLTHILWKTALNTYKLK